VAVALGVGVAIAVLAIQQDSGAKPSELVVARLPVSTPATSRRTAAGQVAPSRSVREMSLMRRLLSSAAQSARRLGGTIQVAAWADGWNAPVVVGDDLDEPMRMWSMAKPVDAIAAMKLAAQRHLQLTPAFALALQRAIQRSENCSARRLVLELQHLAGSPAGARRTFAMVLGDAHAHPLVATEEDGPSEQSADCEAFLDEHAAGLPSADGVAMLFGTSRWTVTDAVRFAHALGDGAYGSAGARVMHVMQLPKELSQEPGATFTADVRWGAGVAFRGYRVSYKAGWGGTQQQAFLAGQIAIVTDGRRRVAVAAMFHPSVQPSIDDPGETEAPRALEDVFGAVAEALPTLAPS
jgi:hypothetical protein